MKPLNIRQFSHKLWHMKPYLQKIASGPSSFAAFVRNDPAFPFDWHYHPEYELTLITESQGQRLVGDGIADYGPGDLVLLGPNVPHSWRSGPMKSEAQTLTGRWLSSFAMTFSESIFSSLRRWNPSLACWAAPRMVLPSATPRQGAKVASYIADLPSLVPAKRLAKLLSALADLASEEDARVLSTLQVKPTCRGADQQRIDAVCLYLNEHFGDEIDFAELSERLHMDQASLCRFFKRATGRTMTAYLNELRVGAAAQLLIDTDKSVLEIGFRVGFGNYSNFNRQFKRIKGFGPRTLRCHFSPNLPPDSYFTERTLPPLSVARKSGISSQINSAEALDAPHTGT